MASQTIVEVGAEGGSLTVVGEKNAAGEWKCGGIRNETLFYDPEDDPDGTDYATYFEKTECILTFLEAIAWLDRWPWVRLYPVEVHPEFRDSVLLEVRIRGGNAEETRWREQLWPATHFLLASDKEKFLHHFPAGFSDSFYLKNEREYKVRAHYEFQSLFVKGEAQYLLGKNEIESLVKRCLSVLGSLNLLSRYENSAFRDAMQNHDAARTFFSALLSVVRSDMIYARDFESYIEAVASLPAKRGRVATWPVATIFPYITQPTRHLFLKPLATKAAAEALGFDLQYNATLNWVTYVALLRMGHIYLDLLKEMGAQDFIDVQSYIYVAGGGYESDTKESRKLGEAGKNATTSPELNTGAGIQTAKGPQVNWVESDEPNNGHGVQFFHDKIRIEDGRPVCIAFLEGYGWRSGGPATVRLLAARPPLVSPDHWSEMIESVREAVLAFLSNQGTQTSEFRHGPISVVFNA